MATDSMYLENLEEYVNDEGKIVTYKWLSLNLHVHVNEAKQMLYTFVEKQREKKEEVTATYFVSGLSKPNDGCQVYTCTVIPEEELESYKNSLSTVHSVHVYSVQKASLKDSNSLYLADYDCVKENLFDVHKYSSIKYGKAKPTSDVKRPQAKPVKEEPKVTQINSSTTNGHPTASKTKKDPKKAGIAGMFANASKNTEDKKIEDHKPETEGPSVGAKQDRKPQKDSKKGGVMNFFANHTGKKGAPKSEEVQKEDKRNDEKKKDSPPKQNGRGKRSKKTRDAESDEEESKKKRRRIRMDVSDSSEEEMDYESPAPSPVPSPPREPSPVPDSPEKESPKKEENSVKPAQNGERHRVRRRKLVPKTFMDDDGFMVTEKVWESESTDASDTEPPPPVKDTPKAASPQKKKASPKKKSPPSTASRKQMSISSFFVKK
ncbi:DNA polymerase delta subunit 3-like [Saccostrea echinata]|uniref:DNA polymerase delta subunit 3-like n=1 Tax=Saccostrea echinata TaxID=191078 RepID=UPI002A828929|nr:DNA polymerase delta subunit 3-like [Saccostrea echinata]